MKAQLPITWYETIDSTNSEARRHIGDGDKMSVFAAEYQTAGRGQRGNKWASTRGQNLMFSILADFTAEGMPEVNAGEQFLLSIISALAVSDLLECYGIRNRIKWPNDIYIGDRKICGMLLENSLTGNTIGSSIIGIGLNVNQTEFPPELMNPTSMTRVTGHTYTPEDVLTRLLDCFLNRFRGLSDRNGRKSLKKEYTDRLYRLLSPERYHDCITGNDFRGRIKGISDAGLLLMEMPDDSLRKYAFKEVSYII